MRVLAEVCKPDEPIIHKGIVSTGVQEQRPGMCSHTERITHEFMDSRSPREQDKILGRKGYDKDLCNVMGKEFIGARLFTVGIFASLTYSPALFTDHLFFYSGG